MVAVLTATVVCVTERVSALVPEPERVVAVFGLLLPGIDVCCPGLPSLLVPVPDEGVVVTSPLPVRCVTLSDGDATVEVLEVTKVWSVDPELSVIVVTVESMLVLSFVVLIVVKPPSWLESDTVCPVIGVTPSGLPVF